MKVLLLLDRVTSWMIHCIMIIPIIIRRCYNNYYYIYHHHHHHYRHPCDENSIDSDSRRRCGSGTTGSESNLEPTKEQREKQQQQQQQHQQREHLEQLEQWNKVIRILFPLPQRQPLLPHLECISHPCSSCCGCGMSSSPSSTTTTTTPPTVLPQHLQQKYDWDCGITCLEMIFQWLHVNQNGNHTDTDTDTDTDDAADNVTFKIQLPQQPISNTNASDTRGVELRNWMIETVGTTSIWTIDLVYLLHEFQKQKQLQRQHDTKKNNNNNGDDDGRYHFTYVMMTRSSLFIKNTTTSTDNHNNSDTDDDDDYYLKLPYYTEMYHQDRIRIQQRVHDMMMMMMMSLMDAPSHEKEEAEQQQVDNSNDTTTTTTDDTTNSTKTIRTLLGAILHACPPRPHSISDYSSATNNTSTKSFVVSMEQLVYCIQQYNCIAIALVDNSILLSNNNDNTSQASCTSTRRNHQYVGHYIIIAGVVYNNKNGSSCIPSDHTNKNCCSSCGCCQLVVYNPGRSSSNKNDTNTTTTTTATPEYISLQHFERAWRANGTDDDIIFIARQS